MQKQLDPGVERVAELLLSNVALHGTLETADEAAIRKLTPRTRSVSAGEDIVRQGDRPNVAVIVLGGMLARYHTLEGGDRQYLSFHIAGDMPDIQCLFLTVMDHSLCALGEAVVGVVPHDQLTRLIRSRPAVGLALWRLTFVDASIFRQAITNNGARPHLARLAHLLCEQYERARQASLAVGRSCDFPVRQAQIAQALGMSAVSVHRALQKLRRDRLADLRSGKLEILNWPGLIRLAGFDPAYLHLKTEP
ncbi:MAG TPA: Crp/Fnr family transcriptional regulator [Roseiarcus sp.]|nr:Crp/Fnr family transcriptional regulator [Roseiarcus sp.]